MQPSVPPTTSRSGDKLSLVSRLAVTLIALAAIATAIVWAGTFSGPYRWLVEWQLANWDAYSAEGTWAVLLLLLALMLAAALSLAARLGVLRTESGGPLPWLTWKNQLRSTTEWMRARKLRLAFLGAGFFLVGAGIAECVRAQTAGPLIDIDAAQLEPTKPLPGNWLRVRGRALTDAAIAVESTHRSDSPETYIPLVPLEWTASQPVAAFLRQSDRRKVAGDGDRSFSGVLVLGGLPGMIRHEFQNRGLNPAEKARVLEWGARPDDLRFGGILQIILGSLVSIATGLMWIVIGYREQSKAAAKNVTSAGSAP